MPDFLVVCFLPSGFRVANRIQFLNEHYFSRFIALLDVTACSVAQSDYCTAWKGTEISLN